MEQEIGVALGREVVVMSVPHLLPVMRGILELDLHAPARRHARGRRARAFEALFAKSPSYGCSTRRTCRRKTSAPPISANSASCSSADRNSARAHRDREPRQSAAGQAVQDLDLMLGHDEAAGLLGVVPCREKACSFVDPESFGEFDREAAGRQAAGDFSLS